MTDQELKDLVAGLAVSGERVDRQLEELKLRQEETARQMEETDRQMKETDRKVKEVCGKVGGIDENLGHHAEQFFQDVFKRKKEFGGVKYKRIHRNFIGEDDNNEKIEIDILLVNGDSVALIEVKNRIHPNFVTEFAQERVVKFRKLCPEYDNYKIYLGIAGFSFDKKVLESAKENGIGIVKQLGESVEIEAEHLRAY
jgi:hypothetical protein